MNNKILAVLIGLSAIATGLVGELMPDELKEQIETYTVSSLGFSYTTVWLVVLLILVLLTVFFIWREAKNTNPQRNTNTSTTNLQGTNVVNQRGQKSVYIERNEGDINIQ